MPDFYSKVSSYKSYSNQMITGKGRTGDRADRCFWMIYIKAHGEISGAIMREHQASGKTIRWTILRFADNQSKHSVWGVRFFW
jgi:hypothetical protein